GVREYREGMIGRRAVTRYLYRNDAGKDTDMRRCRKSGESAIRKLFRQIEDAIHPTGGKHSLRETLWDEVFQFIAINHLSASLINEAIGRRPSNAHGDAI